MNGYNLEESVYEKLIQTIYGFEEYYYYKQDKHYKDYLFILNELDKIKRDVPMDEFYKNAIIGWYIFFKNSKRFLHTNEYAMSITDACQLKCKHCYDQHNPRKNAFMSYELFVDLFYKHKQYARNFVHCDNIPTKKIFLLGGEPTLNPDLLKIMNFLNEENVRYTLETNGIFVSNEIKHLLKKHNANVSVSIDGVYDKHDFIRGDGSFNKSVSTIKDLLKEGISVNTGFVVNSYNYDCVDEYKRFFSSIGIKHSGVMRYIDQNNEFIKPINYEQYKTISKYIKDEPEIVCNVGNQTIINSNGGWRPCGKLSIPEVANYILDTEEEFVKKIKLFVLKFRSVPVYCFDCKLVETCRGGQVCSQYKRTNTFNLVDITCLNHSCKQKGDFYKI